MAAPKRNVNEAVRLMLVTPTKPQTSSGGQRIDLKDLVRMCGLRLIDGKVHS